MKKALIVLMSAMFLLPAAGVAAQQSDSAGCKDHLLFPTRMPEYRLADCKVEDYGVYEFFATKGPKTSVEGKFTFIIAPGRLRSYGCGQFAPVATNDTEEGRAKNRRVELVKQ